LKSVLNHNSYGKSSVRLTKVVRRASEHELIEMSVDILFEGDFAASYTEGDNANVVATDSMKNTVYVLARENSFDSIEAFALLLARHFVMTYKQVSVATVSIRQPAWDRIQLDGRPHPHAFVAGGSEMRICRASTGPAGLSGGISGLKVLKTTDSEFAGFVTDRYRTLKDTHDRIMATSVNAEWQYSPGKPDFNASFAAARTALLATFAAHHSLAVQQTLLAMGEAVLAACPAVQLIKLELPNLHRIPFDLEKFGLKNENDIFVPVDEPHGLITGEVKRR
jgi:urate oxidase